MSLFSYFNLAAEKALARTLAEQLAKSLPPNAIEERRTVLSVNKLTRLLEQTYATAQTHQSHHQMGVLKRAVLANRLKWELLDRGYPKDFVEIAIEGLVVQLSKPTATRKTK